MPRKYEVLTCPECGAGVRIEPTEGGTEGVCLSCDWSERGDFDDRRDIRKPLPVTAIDARDVEPLRDALRQISKAKPTTGVPLKDTLAGCRQLATSALKAFEDEEGSGG